MTLLLTTQCPVIFAAMGAAPEVVAHASEYMRMRCLASPAILMCVRREPGAQRGCPLLLLCRPGSWPPLQSSRVVGRRPRDVSAACWQHADSMAHASVSKPHE